MQKFDIDDLSFFRVCGYGLRHTALEFGKREQQEGNTRGDAVSIANYGLKTTNTSPKFTQELTKQFQENVEHFILESFKCFQKPHTNYKQAAFLLLSRDSDATSPYDFDFYPLGKCGTKEFTADQVELLITSEGDQYNEGMEDAASKVFVELVHRLHQLKKMKAQKMLTSLDQPHPRLTAVQRQKIQSLLSKLIIHYDQQTEIGSDVFLQIFALVNRKADGNLEQSSILYNDQSAHYLSLTVDSIIETQHQILDQLDTTNKKIGKLQIINPIIEDLNELAREPSKTKLKAKLIHYIQISNIPKIEACLNLLGECEFDKNDESPLRAAAEHPNHAILRQIYERYASQHVKSFQGDGKPTPVFHAAYSLRYNNLDFLLTKQQGAVLDRDFSGSDKHILIVPIYSGSDESYNIVQLLLEHGCTIGNDIKNLYKNPLARCATNYQELAEKKLSLLLPKANAGSKYLAMRAIAEELSYAYKSELANDRIEKLQTSLKSIVISCTSIECQEIAELYRTGLDSEVSGREILEAELTKEYANAVTFGKNRIINNVKAMGFAPIVQKNEMVASPKGLLPTLGFLGNNPAQPPADPNASNQVVVSVSKTLVS